MSECQVIQQLISSNLYLNTCVSWVMGDWGEDNFLNANVVSIVLKS